MKCYSVKYIDKEPLVEDDGKRSGWKKAGSIALSHFRPEASSYCPRTQVKIFLP
jgi:hypothetical protein